MLSKPVVEDGHYTYKLHTRDVPPSVLRRELERLLGSSHGQWYVEMRHNVYNIQSCTNFDLKDLVSNCQKGSVSATPRTFSAQNLRQRALDESTPRRLPDTPRIHFVTLKSEEVNLNDKHDITDTEGPTSGTDRHTAGEQPVQLA